WRQPTTSILPHLKTLPPLPKRQPTVWREKIIEYRHILQKNQNVCFEFDINAKIVKAENACDWGMQYQSVIGFGKASFIVDPMDKRKALYIIMNQYSDRPVQFPENAVSVTAVIKIEITSMTGKQSGFKCL
ncbi:MAG: pyridoxamine 5'-phosphate oxidase family protein, partial [Deltaproteobacteria bacterium]|nr:pyridoxamine 5'-phosphate oxidase family protein [Deltaproteobacteria bacterium]